jgi:hypothetical protein
MTVEDPRVGEAFDHWYNTVHEPQTRYKDNISYMEHMEMAFEAGYNEAPVDLLSQLEDEFDKGYEAGYEAASNDKP